MEYTRFMFLAVYSGRAIMYDKRYKIYTYHFLLYLLHPQIQISNGHLNYSSDVPELSNLENILFVCICYSYLIIEAGKNYTTSCSYMICNIAVMVFWSLMGTRFANNRKQAQNKRSNSPSLFSGLQGCPSHALSMLKTRS